MTRRHRMLALPFAVLLLLGLAGQALAAPAPSYSGTIAASKSCLITFTASWKNTKAVATVNASLYEVGYVNPAYPTIPNYVASYAWPGSGPNGGVQKGSTVTFAFGPTGADTATHGWYALVQFYAADGSAITDVTTSTLSTRCYLP